MWSASPQFSQSSEQVDCAVHWRVLSAPRHATLDKREWREKMFYCSCDRAVCVAGCVCDQSATRTAALAV